MRWGLNSPASWLFDQPFVQAKIKENIKVPRHWPLWGNSSVAGEVPAKGPATRKTLPFDDVMMRNCVIQPWQQKPVASSRLADIGFVIVLLLKLFFDKKPNPDFGGFNFQKWNCSNIDLNPILWYVQISSNLYYKFHLGRQWNCWSARRSWSIACRRCSNYIFILDSTPGFNVLGRGNCKTKQDTFECWDLVRLILEVWR